MKKNTFLWALLPMTAALVMTACSNDDNMTEASQQDAVKTISYSVTVNDGVANVGTRAAVDSDNKTLKFASGDKLYISSDSRTDLKGTLTLKSGDEGKSSGATFEGELTYTGDAPASTLEIKATLVGTNNLGVQISDGKVTGMNYPTTAYCSTVNDAVEKYSNLTGTSTFGTKSFTLTQQTAFLNFVITFEDGTATGTSLTAVVSNNESAICTANVTTTTEDAKVVAKFVLPVASGTTLTSATVKMGDKEALSISNATLTGKVYNVNREVEPTYPIAMSAVTAAYIGSVITSDGNVYKNTTTATAAGKTSVAVIAYVGDAGSVDESSSTYKGLAIAMKDANSGNACAYYTDNSGICVKQNSYIAAAITYKNGFACTNTLVNSNGSGVSVYCSGHTHAAATAAKNNTITTESGITASAPSGTSGWFLPSMGQWNLIVQGLATKKSGSTVSTALTTSSNSTYQASNLNSVITDAGGTGFQAGGYWSSTEYGTERAWYMYFGTGRPYDDLKTNNHYVRAVLAF
jgi:hypothetical protein